MFSSTIIVVLHAAVLVAASVSATTRPVILTPSGMDIWVLGEVFTVSWLTNGYNLTGLTGTVLFGHVDARGNPTFWKNQPLAQGFPLTDGEVNVRCPLNLRTGPQYVVALVSSDGPDDDSNISAVFQVKDDNDFAGSASLIYPVTLSTTGNVPSATITHTSVVGTIPPPSSIRSSASTMTDTPSSSSFSAYATTTGKNGGSGMTPSIPLAAMAMGLLIFPIAQL